MEKRPQYIDIHAHINFAAYDTDRDAVIQRAKDADVWMINVGTDLKTSREVIELADAHEGMYAIIGLHPIHSHPSHHDSQEQGASEDNEGELFSVTEYEKLVQHPKVVGIGECGLDYFHLPKDPELANLAKQLQEDAFRAQIELAIKYDKPIMIHARNSYGRILEIIDEYLSKGVTNLRGNAHFFAGTVEEAKAFLERSFTISCTGVITFAKQYAELVQFMPLESLMSETDCPYVTPVPYRGTRNEPVYVIEVVKKIAELKNLELEEVKNTLVDNAFRTFKL